MDDDETEVSDPGAAPRAEPATGERGDHHPAPPGVEMPGAETSEAPDDPETEEPEPGEHPNS